MEKMLTAGLVLLATLFAALGGNAMANSESYPLGERSVFSDRAVSERIQPVGSVCVEGDECGTAMAASGGGDGEPRSGEEVYSSGCASCHDSGAAGAPKTGDSGAWASRIDKGMDTLVKHAYEGFNAMPAKGMCSDCSEEEIESAVQHMVDQSQ